MVYYKDWRNYMPMDAFALMNIIKIAEKDVENGKVRNVDDVFKDLREKITENG